MPRLQAPRVRAPYAAVLFVIATSALVGGIFGRDALATDDRVLEYQKTFSAALGAIESNYVETVDADRLVYGAIRGMLATLDPHSSFYDPKEYSAMRERQEGRYYGLGITIQALNGDITASSVFEGSPAFKKGIRRGDIIAKIGDQDAKGWTTDQAMKNLRGPKGTVVQINIKRRGYAEPIPIEVTRDEVQILTVPAYFMLDATTGYIRHQDWGENTDREIQHALRELKAKGMKRLLYDIRANPGGPLTQAIKVSGEFLRRGDMVVYTEGRVSNSSQKYVATEATEFTDVPMVVIANRNSASASEIFTGALQDHDRAYIVGETTFGKALVQSVYPISGGAALALTTAHYFTPRGRLIQRPWDETFDEYLSYTQRDQDVNKPHKPADLRRTAAGRPVYSGGGIEPDHRMDGPMEGFNPGKFARRLYPGMFATFAQRFDREGDTRFGAATDVKARRAITREFVIDDAMIQEFKTFVRGQMKDASQFDEAGFNADIEFIKAMIRYEIDVALFDVATARRHLLEKDPQAQYALTLLPEAESLLRATSSTSVKASR